MAQIQRTINTYEIGQVANLGVKLQDAFCFFEIPAERHELYVASGDNDDPEVVYLEGLKGVLLAPVQTPSDSLLANYTQTDSVWINAVPENSGGAQFMLHTKATDIASRADSNYNFPANPCIRLRVISATERPDGQATFPSWTFGLYNTAESCTMILTWGMLVKPTLNYIDKDDVVKTVKLDISDSEQERYFSSNDITWTIYYFDASVGTYHAGDLYILCSALSEPWIIRDVKPIPPCRHYVAADAGMWYAFNAQPMRFKTSGTLTLPMTEHFGIYDFANAYRKDAFGYYQSVDGVSEVNISVANETGTKKSYLISFVGDGYHTPLIQAFQVFYRAVYDVQGTLWDDISDQVIDARENVPMDAAGRTLDITFSNNDNVISNALAALDPTGAMSYRNGTAAIRWSLGYLLSDGSTPSQARGVAVLRGRDLQTGVGQLDTLQVTAVDRAQTFVGALLSSPSFFKWPAEEAVAMAAECAGVHPDDIVIDMDFSTDSIDAATPLWTRGTDANFGITLGDPLRNYHNAPWRPPPGSAPWDFITQISERFKLCARFDTDGKLHIFNKLRAATPVADYSSTPGEPTLTSLKTASRRRDLADAANGFFAQGRDADGKPLYAFLYDYDSIATPGSDGYLGGWVLKSVGDDNLVTQDQTDLAVGKEMADALPIGRATFDVNTLGGYDRMPLDRITVWDAEIGATPAVECRVTGMSIKHGHILNETDIQAEEVE